MLSISEFSCSPIGLVHPLSLILPMSRYDQKIVVAGSREKRMAVFIGEQHKYESFEIERENKNWYGLIVGDISVEVDENSIFNPQSTSAPMGSIIREENRLVIQTKTGHYPSRLKVPLYENLPALENDCRVAFWRWQIFVGELTEKRILAKIDVGPIADA